MASLSREEFERRYPFGSYDDYVDSERVIKAFYGLPVAELNAALVAAHDEALDAGLNTE